MPNMRRLGGGVKGGKAASGSVVAVLVSSRAGGLDSATISCAGGTDCVAGVNCWPSGERGGERTGREDIGDGGTKGNDSRMESARVEVVETTDVPDIRFDLSSPWARARACACSKASCCCSWSVPGALGDKAEAGETSFAMVVLYEDF